MRKLIIALIVIVLLGVGGWFGYTTYYGNGAAQPQAQPQTQTQANQTASPNSAPPASVSSNRETVIWASGELVPAQWAGLSPEAGGRIMALHVAEGDVVAAGDLLVELDNGILQSQVDIATAALAEAEAAQAKLLAGATAAQIAGAEAQLAAAQAGIASAQAQEEQVKAGVAAAEAQVAIAQAQYVELASHPTPGEVAAAQGDLGVAQAAVRQAQASYNVVKGDPNIGSRPESLALQQATEHLNAAQARHDLALQGATPAQLSVANSQILAAQAQVTVAGSQLPAVAAGVLSAQAGVDGAQASLDALLDGATAEDRAMAAARVNSARAQLAAAQAQLAQTRITAPFAGQVGMLFKRTGELASPGVPVLMLGDTAQMRVETTDLQETDVTQLAVGLPLEVTFDALPDQTFTGTISRIAPMSTTDKGSTNFQVVIDVDNLAPSLRWGMTALVSVAVGR